MTNDLWLPDTATRRGVSLIRQLRQEDIVCPAGEVVGDAGVRCKVEQSTIEGRTNPETVTNFCMGHNEHCPSWQAEQERIKSGRKELFDTRDRDALKAQREARRERIEAIKERLWDPGPAGQKFRRKLGLKEVL